MSPENFTYWLQGYFEIAQTEGWQGLTEKQARIIKDHLKLVFEKRTPVHVSGILNQWDSNIPLEKGVYC